MSKPVVLFTPKNGIKIKDAQVFVYTLFVSQVFYRKTFAILKHFLETAKISFTQELGLYLLKDVPTFFRNVEIYLICFKMIQHFLETTVSAKLNFTLPHPCVK
jgi:hypothetical protein